MCDGQFQIQSGGGGKYRYIAYLKIEKLQHCPPIPMLQVTQHT